MTPDAEIKLARSALSFELVYMLPLASRREAVSACPGWMTVPDRTERGNDSRLPPNIDPGARALIDALVSTELRLRRLDDDASVRIEASSVKRLSTVAEW